MNINTKENTELAVMYLEKMAAGKFPISNTVAESDSDINSTEIVRCLFFIRDVINELIKENAQNKNIEENEQINQLPHENNSKSKPSRKSRKLFPLECLEKYTYESDRSITNFVTQLRNLADDPFVKGMSVKRITDWLKQNEYLQDVTDPYTSERTTSITIKGEEAGLYPEVRKTRFGQEYEVIMYSEKAQKWIVDHMSDIIS